MDSFHHWLMKSHLGFRKKLLSHAQSYGLTAGQPKVLEYLDEVGSTEQKSIAKFCEIEPATVGSILSRMEKNGLIVRQREADNKRCVIVTLTDKGKQIAKEAQALYDRMESQALSGLSPEQCETLRQALKTVYNNLQNL